MKRYIAIEEFDADDVCLSRQRESEEHPLTPFVLIAAVAAVGYGVSRLLRAKGWT